MHERPIHAQTATKTDQPAYGTECSVTDYILGITFEIWEEGQVEEILRYYSEDCVVFGLDGITRGAQQMVEQTRATLSAFPDRLLIGEDVIWAGTVAKGFSSHRITSPMTNLGPTAFGPATGRGVRVMNVADCEIAEALIVREWLVRDNLALVSQLGFNPVEAARGLAARLDSDLQEWLEQEHERVRSASPGLDAPPAHPGTAQDLALAQRVLGDCWVAGDRHRLESAYAPYCVMHRAPVRVFSGRAEILAHYADWRKVMPDAQISIDHVCGQPFGVDGRHVAVRWSVAGNQQAPLQGCPSSGQPLYILGVTHWRVLAGRIISEWTVFDELAVMAQSLSRSG